MEAVDNLGYYSTSVRLAYKLNQLEKTGIMKTIIKDQKTVPPSKTDIANVAYNIAGL